jgi:hypothetical protein
MADSARSTLALSLHTSDCERTAHRGQLRLVTVDGAEAGNAGFENPGSDGATSAAPRRTFLSTFGRLIKAKTPDANVIVDADFWDHRHRS